MSALSTPPDAETANAEEWWKICSTAQLKEIVSVGIAAGDRFDIAVREIERRSSESRILADSYESEKRQREAKRDRAVRLAVAGAALALVFIVALIFWG